MQFWVNVTAWGLQNRPFPVEKLKSTLWEWAVKKNNNANPDMNVLGWFMEKCGLLLGGLNSYLKVPG